MRRYGKYALPADRPLVMGIVNITPDSFSGDGLAKSVDAAIEYAMQQVAAGADLLDIGAESSRPGCIPTSESEELARLMPVLGALKECHVPISVDSYKPVVMQAAIKAGASIVNDIYALRWPGAMDVVKDSDVSICLMHMQGEPLSMQTRPQYENVLAEVRSFLENRVRACIESGIAKERILLDPGFGFGKSCEHNFQMLAKLKTCCIDGYEILIGLSRKTMLGEVTGRGVPDRMPASVAGALIAAQNGADIVRVHDVAATKDALAVWGAVRALSD